MGRFKGFRNVAMRFITLVFEVAFLLNLLIIAFFQAVEIIEGLVSKFGELEVAEVQVVIFLVKVIKELIVLISWFTLTAIGLDIFDNSLL